MSDKPAKKFRIGSVTATVWANENGDGRKFYSVNVSRSYKDGDEWKNADSFPHGDLLNLGRVAARAENWIAEQG